MPGFVSGPRAMSVVRSSEQTRCRRSTAESSIHDRSRSWWRYRPGRAIPSSLKDAWEELSNCELRNGRDAPRSSPGAGLQETHLTAIAAFRAAFPTATIPPVVVTALTSRCCERRGENQCEKSSTPPSASMITSISTTPGQSPVPESQLENRGRQRLAYRFRVALGFTPTAAWGPLSESLQSVPSFHIS